MIQIPEELLEQFERGNVIPLVGSNVNQGVLPTEDVLAQELASRCDYPPGEPVTLCRVAGYYLLTSHDRHGLVSFLRDRLDRTEAQPSRSHRLLARLQPRVVVTSCYDGLLGQAWEEAGIGYTPVIRNEEVAYSDEQKTMLVWLRGILDRPDSMIVTEDDHRRFLSGRESVSDVLRGEMARRTWLFIGFALEEEWFPNYYDSVIQGLDRHRRRAYIVGSGAVSAYNRAWWTERAQILDVEVEPFLEELIGRLNAREQAVRQRGTASATMAAISVPEEEPEPLPERPYKLLDFYEASDAGIFFGREAETQKLTALIHAHRLTLLYGGSGTGKTSLLLAGVAPRLQAADAGYAFFYLRALEDPEEIIRSAVRRRCPDLTLPDTLSLVDFLAMAAQRLNATMVITVDQAEEFFIRFSSHRRQQFIAQLGALYDAREVPVKIVLSLREDWLASVNEIRERIPEVFYVDLRLLPLTRKQARQAITGPAERLGMRYDPALVERFLDDLSERTPRNENALVMPPQLQLVCDALYERAHSEGRSFIGMADYEEVGGAEGILVRYVEEALGEYRGEEREIARAALVALVTSHGTKAGARSEQLAAEAGVEAERLMPVLARLTSQRLVRRLEDGDSYELTHDILAETIDGWIGEEERRLKQLQEMLRREVADWRRDPHVLLGRVKFERVNERREELQLTAEETEFLLRAAVLYDEALPYWLQRVEDRARQVTILLEMLEQEPLARLTAVTALGAFTEERVGQSLARVALEDEELAVRDAAATSLARSGSAEGVAALLAAQREGVVPQTRALRALALIKEAEPALLANGGGAGIQVDVLLGQIRLQRAGAAIRQTTIAAALGGALAFGLALLPSIALSTIQNAASPAPVLLLLLLLLPVLGLFAGGMMGLGMALGGALLGRRSAAGRIVGGVLLGAAGCAISLFAVASGEAILLQLAGGGLFGAAVALGITLPMALLPERSGAIPVGGAVAGGLGLLLAGILGFDSFQVGSLPLLTQGITGALAGLMMALSIMRVFVEARRPQEVETRNDERARIISQA